MGHIKKADLKAAQEFKDNNYIRSTKDDIIVMSSFFVDKYSFRALFFKKVLKQGFVFNLYKLI